MLRANRVVAVAAVLVISFGVKMFFLSAPTAEANIHGVPSANMNVLQMHIDHPNRNSLVPEKLNDMSLVFSAPD
jgi:SpoU rRNA methylase family enzyme